MKNSVLFFNWFFIGIFAALFSLIIEIELLNPLAHYSIESEFKSPFNSYFIYSSLFEEILKIILVGLFFKLNFQIIKKTNSFFYGVAAGLGFAFVETILLYFKNNLLSFSSLYWGMIIIHILTFSIAIYFWEKKKNKLAMAILVLVINFIIHFSYNSIVFYL